MPAKLYVGNLAFSVTNEDLEALFGQMGKVDNVAVVTDKFSGQSRGFGFVQMADSNEAARAIAELDGTEAQGPQHQGERGARARAPSRRRRR